MAFLTQTLTNLDTNSVGSITSSVDVTGQTMIAWRVVPVSGSHNNHKISLRGSFDNVNFFKLKSRLQGADVTSIEHDFSIGYIKFRVSTTEGSASKVNIFINAK